MVDYPDGEKLATDAVIDIDCDNWIPAARPDVIRKDNVDRLRTKLVPQGANIPFTLEAERILHEKDVLIVPDFIANPGGLICASLEYHGGTQTQAFATIVEKIRANTEQVLAHAKNSGLLPRHAAVQLAEHRVRQAMGLQAAKAYLQLYRKAMRHSRLKHKLQPRFPGYNPNTKPETA